MKLIIKGMKDQKSVNLQIYNSQGAVVRSQLLAVKSPGYIEEEIVFSDALAPGIYIARAGETLYLTQKFMVE